MKQGKVFITDYGFANLEQEKRILGDAGYHVEANQCKTAEEVARNACDADALLVQWAPLSADVIRQLKKCKIIVRYGIGTDNVDLQAAKEKGIPVCNIPDYCVDEVADHTLAMTLALGRQLKDTESQIRHGIWEIMPPKPLPPFREMIFATAGFGRIAREVLKRAKVFNFVTASYDPYISKEEMYSVGGVKKLDKESLFRDSDILSLHLPLKQDTFHFINKEQLKNMKKDAILINTSRGELVDTLALAEALQQDQIGAAGLDVFEKEPLQNDHPIRKCKHIILTSHCAWYSQKSGEVLQRMAAQEVLRGLKGMPLTNRVN